MPEAPPRYTGGAFLLGSWFLEREMMVFDVSVAMTWILFLALFPITFYWLRRAWRIVVRKDCPKSL